MNNQTDGYGYISYRQLSKSPFNTYKLIALTKWLPKTKENIQFLEKEYVRINLDPIRKAYIVVKDIKFALFVDQVA